MIEFNVYANKRVKEYLHRNANSQDKRAIKAFFLTLKKENLSKARMVALVKGSINIRYLIDNLCWDYSRAYPYSVREFTV